MRRLLALLFVLSFAITACDTQDGLIDPPDSQTEPEAPSVPIANAADLSSRIFNVTLDSLGTIGQVYNQTESEVMSLFRGALWFAGQQDGQLRVAAAQSGRSTYGTCDTTPRGVYVLDADSTYDTESWPTDAGAPTAPSGEPQVYGDEMLWMTTCPQTARWFLDQPFADVRTNIAVFGHDALPHVVFLRYEIRNEGTSAITDAYVGFWSDPDLESTVPGHGTYVRENLIGFDVDLGLGYVYVDEMYGAPGWSLYDGTRRPDSERGHVAGSIILESPHDAALAAHRMMDKAAGPFGESSMDAAEDYSFALRGLNNSGTPMIDPITDQPSTFAYTGDPVARTGWLDGFDYCGSECQEGIQAGEELRQLVSVGPFSLAAGETGVFTVAYMVRSGTNLADGLQLLRDDASQLQSQPSLWRYPVES